MPWKTKTTHFFDVFFKMVWGALLRILFASLYCGTPDAPKNIRVLGSYFSIALPTKTRLPRRQARSMTDKLF